MIRVTLLLALLAVGLCLVALAGPEKDLVVLTGFERDDGKTTCESSEHEFLSTGAMVGGGAVRWKVAADAEGARLITRFDELDLRAYGLLRLRYRLKAPFDGVVWVGLYSQDGGMESPVRSPSDEWCTLEIPLAGMWKQPGFDPEKAGWFVLTTHQSAALEIDVDEVELLKTPGGWRGASGGDGFVYNLADFEMEARSSFDISESCKAEVVEDGDGHVLRLTPHGRHAYLTVSLGNVPEDIRPFRLLKFRARVASGSGRGLELSIYGGGGSLETELPRLTKEWQPIEVILPDMDCDETFIPQDTSGLRIYGFSSEKRVVELDDFRLVVKDSGWQYSALERLDLGRHAFAPLKRVADFEREDAADRVDMRACEVERVPVKRRRGNSSGSALKVTFPEDANKSELILRQVPSDLRDYRILRFKARVDKTSEADVQVRLISHGTLRQFSFGSDRGSLAFDILGFERNWKSYELLLPEAHRLGDFEPQRVTGLKISRSGPLTLYVDEFELVKAGGGCLNTDRQEMKRLFGDEAADRISEIETKRFRVWTDLAKPDRKLGKHLESVWEHAQKTLELPPPVLPVEIYLFAEKEAWAEPLLKKSWTVHQVAAAAGYSHAGSFSTYAQDFKARPFVHELTHAILQRTVGCGGGEWLQEGVAGYVAASFAKKSPADEYRSAVPKRHRRPLPDLLVMQRLPAEAQGSPRLMAAAFVEFLLRGPRAKQTKQALATLVLLDALAPAYFEAVEKVMGATLDDLKKEWSAWLDGE